ncbi:MAG: AI-2E family transporter [Muribaculaceae bacterium]|nr:AI-2E family transporter [Muribaculaceae bacterium]
MSDSNIAQRQRKPYTLDRTVRLIIAVVIVCAAIYMINYLRSVLLPFVIACVLAYIIHPLVNVNKQILRIKNNVLAVIVTLFQILFIGTALCMFLFPYLIDEVGEMLNMFSRYTQNYSTSHVIEDTLHNYLTKYFDFESLSKLLTQEQWMSMLETSARKLWELMGSSIKMIFAVVSWLIILLYLVFILIDYEGIKTGFKNMLPPKYAVGIMKVVHDIENTMNHYFRGQALLSLIVGILFSIGFLIIGLPLAVVFGLLIGVLNMVPYLQLISLPIAALLSLVLATDTGTAFWIVFLEVIAVYGVVQLIEDIILTPRIMGKYMGLNPAIIFLSLSVWGTMLGFIGFIIALPLTTLCISYYKEYIVNRAPLPGQGDTPE